MVILISVAIKNLEVKQGSGQPKVGSMSFASTVAAVSVALKLSSKPTYWAALVALTGAKTKKSSAGTGENKVELFVSRLLSFRPPYITNSTLVDSTFRGESMDANDSISALNDLTSRLGGFNGLKILEKV